MDNTAHLYFSDNFKLNLGTAGVVAVILGCMNLFTRTVGGYIADRCGKAGGLRGRVYWLFAVLLLEGAFMILFSQMRTTATAIAGLMVFGMCVDMACGATYAVVPFISKKSLGSVSGIVGAIDIGTGETPMVRKILVPILKSELCMKRILTIFSSLLMMLLSGIATASTATTQPTRPAYNVEPWAENWTFLKSTPKQSDLFDPIKFILLDPAKNIYLSLGGEIRERCEYFKNNLFGAGKQDKNGYFLTRLMGHADIHIGPFFRAFFEIKCSLFPVLIAVMETLVLKGFTTRCCCCCSF